MTTAQRWRFRRGLVVVVAYRWGLSQRLIADALCLTHSRVCAILREMAELSAQLKNDRAENREPARLLRLSAERMPKNRPPPT